MAIAAVILAALAAVIAYLYLVAPGLMRDEVLTSIAERYHRTARLDRVRLDPLRLRAEVDGFSLPDRDGRPMISFRRLSARLSWPSLLIGRVAFDDLTLDAPQVRLVRRADGRLNLLDLAPSPAKSKGKPVSVRIARFQLTDGRAVVIDDMRRTPFEEPFDHISFSLRNFATTTDGASYALAGQGDAGERLSWQGSLGIAPLASRGRFTFEGWRADRLAAAIPGGTPFKVTAGVLDAQGAYDVALRGEALSAHVTLDRATLKSAAIRPSGDSADPIRADALSVSGVSLDLAKHAVVVAHLVVTRPDVTAWRSKSGVLNLAALVPPPAARGGQPTGPAWTLSAPDIRVDQGRASFEDREAHGLAAWTADPVDLIITGFAYPLAAPIQVSAHVEADDGSTLTATGSIGLPTSAGASPSGRFDVALDGLELNRFQPYVSQTANVSIASGDASAKGRLELASNGVVRFAGALSVDNLQAVDPLLKSDLVTWDRVTASGVMATSKPFSVKVARIFAQGAYGRVVLEPNYTLNIRAVLEQPGPPPGAAALDITPVGTPKPALRRPGPALDLPIDIDRIDFADGRMDFTDLTVQPHFSAGIQSLAGSITGLSARAGARAEVDLKGGVDPFAPVTITGSLEPFAADRFLDMAMQFHNVEMTTFSPYSGKFAGYRIDKGKLDLDLHYHIENERLDASHHVVISQLQLGDKVDSANATKLPIRLIVALLKDRNGVIDLPIDISGSLDDPKFRIWPVIWRVVDNLLGKIAAAPFTLLGDLVGHGGGEELGHIAFQPGSAELAPQEADKLVALARALDQRPALSVEVPTTVAPSFDGPVLAETAYDDLISHAIRATFRRGTAPDLTKVLVTPKLKRKVFETAYLETFGQAPSAAEAAAPAGAGEDHDLAAAAALEAALRARLSVSSRALQALAQARAQAVETALVQVGHVDPKRVYVVAAPPLTAAPIVMNVALR